MEICPHLIVKNYGDEGMGFCKLTERPSGRIQQCVLEGGDICETWEEIKAEQEVEFTMIPTWLQGWEKESHLACIECGEYKPNDDRVKAGLKCAECAYKGG